MKPRNPLDSSNRAMSDVALPQVGAITGAPSAPATPRAPATPDVSDGATDRALVERARAGDEEAFRMLVDLHRDRAYGLALRITRSREDAADAAQEAFVRAWLALPRFRGDSAFGTWLHRIVARRSLDRALAAQSRRRRETVLEDADLLPAPPGAEAPTGLARRLEMLMESLSPAQRAAASLFYWEDRAVAEIASALEMSENTVKTHLSRARAALRAAWLRKEGER